MLLFLSLLTITATTPAIFNNRTLGLSVTVCMGEGCQSSGKLSLKFPGSQAIDFRHVYGFISLIGIRRGAKCGCVELGSSQKGDKRR